MRAPPHRYRPTETKLKGGAEQMYITYDLWQETRGDGRALYPKVRRVYIAGKVKGWQIGTFEKRSGKQVPGVKIVYEQSRSGHVRKGYTARRGVPSTRCRRRRSGRVVRASPRLSSCQGTPKEFSFIPGNSPRDTATRSKMYAELRISAPQHLSL